MLQKLFLCVAVSCVAGSCASGISFASVATTRTLGTIVKELSHKSLSLIWRCPCISHGYFGA